MADLSAVLRKTIDGLPNATPELRAKVYEKARAAILRQIENANPPLAEEDVSMRRSALEQAIRSTEAHYAAQDAAATLEEPVPARPAPPQASFPPPPSFPPPSGERREPALASAAHPARPSWARKSEGSVPPAVPPAAERPRMPRAETNFERPPGVDAGRLSAEAGRRNGRLEDRYGGVASTEPADGFDIPDADTSAPRYSGARTPRDKRSSKPFVLGAAAVVAVALLGVGGYVYRDQIAGLLGSSSQTQTATNTAPANDSPGGAANQPSNGGAVANLPSGTGQAGGSTPPAGTEAPATDSAPKRQFTQRLLADGSEVDEGPGSGAPNAFDEGTNIAAATPEPTTPPATTPPATSPSAGSPATGTATEPPGTPTATSPTTNATPAVAQKAMYYEERTAALQGTQQTGNVVWTLVNEAPAEGAAPEPAIRAVADVPADKLKMTMTIRRNLDPTLPASHVIELQFDVPPGFEGGQIANVQRLALKPSEEARGEPLIGVAGKISDGFFIIALNNLDKATETNLALLGKQEWIDIPLAYATGRRALMSIEKGVPGDRVFKEAMEAWAAKT